MPIVQAKPRIANVLGHLRRRRVVGASLAALASRRALGQAPWPDRPVRLVSMIPPGQGSDGLVRAIAARWSELFGQPFVVDSRPGAGGTLAAGAVAQATDRHTLGVVLGGPTTTARALNPNLPYDPATAFVPVSLLVRTPFVLTVPSTLGIRDMAGWLALLRAEPGRRSYASIGPGTVTHLAMEELKAREGVAIEHVSYRGFGPATLDLIAGRVHGMFNTPASALPHLREGSLVALAQTGEGRLPQLPEVPTLEEQGFADGSFHGWTGLIAPAGFPPGLAERLAETARETVLRDAAARQVLEASGSEFLATSPAAFARFQARETARWGAVIGRLGLRETD